MRLGSLRILDPPATLKPPLSDKCFQSGVRRCYLTRYEELDGLYLLKTARKIHLKSWFKHVHDNVAILWNLHGFFKLKLSCINEDVLENVKCGSLVEIKGRLISDEEICVESFRVIHAVLENDALCTEDLPRDPVEYTRRYYMFVKHPLILRAVKVYSYMLSYLRDELMRKRFLELPPPIVGQSSDPGLRGARKIAVEIYGNYYELQSSLIMYKQLYASVLDRIFYVARNIRLEPPENAYSGRHLVEFTQVDIEASEVKSDDMIELAENVIYNAVKRLLDEHSDLLDYQEVRKLEEEILRPPYPRLTYDEALSELAKMGISVERGQELPFYAESLLATKYSMPIWIERFPTRARGFYYLEDPEHPGYNVDYNLLLPGGHGEVLDGGCREYRYERLLERIVKIHKEPLEKYSWFLELARKGFIRPTCGWGLGLERLVKYILNLEHVAYSTPHPRIPGIIGP